MTSPSLLLVLSTAAALALRLPAAAQIEPGSEPVSLGPKGGNAISAVVNPTNSDEVLVVTYLVGIFRSLDRGETFGLTPYGTGLGSDVIRRLHHDPNLVTGLFARGENAIYHSADFGATWTPLPFVPPEWPKSLAIAGDTMIVTDAFNIHRSADAGATWTTVYSVVPFGGTVLGKAAISADGSKVFVGFGQGLLGSTDGGLNFGPAGGGSFTQWSKDITVAPDDPDLVMVGTAFNGIFRSTDGGLSFSPVTDPDTAGSSQWFHWEAGRVWYGTSQNIAYSEDDGVTWTSLIDGLDPFTPVPASMYTGPDGTRYLSCESNSLFADQTGGGLYRMPVGPPSSWEHIGFLSSPIPAVAIPVPGGRRVVGFGNGIYTADPGEPLSSATLFLFDTRALAVDPDDPTRWIAGGASAIVDNAQLHLVSGSGRSSVQTYDNFGAGFVQDIEYDPFDSDRVLAGLFPAPFGNEALLGSANGGASWVEIPGTAGWATRDIAFDPHTPGRVIQLSDNNQWAESLDSGTTWSALQPAWPGSSSATFLQFDLFEPGVIYRGDAGMGLWRSDDDGASWTRLGIALDVDSAMLQHPEFPGLIWVGNAVGRLLVSANRGDSFAVALNVPANAPVSSMAIDTSDGSMLVGTDGASAWEFANASPVVKLGDGSAGTGGFVPRLYMDGTLPRIGEPAFALSGDGFLGGATVYLVLSGFQTAVPAFGGTFFVGDPFLLIPFGGSGPAGVAGAGSFTLSGPVPNDPSYVGISAYLQYGVEDPGVAHPDGIVLSDGLSITFTN